MQLFNILKLRFPEASFIYDINLQDDGEGAYIKEWNIKDVLQPTQKDLDIWAIEFQDQYELEQIDLKRQAAYPLKKDLIVALWERVVEGKENATDELQAKREAVKVEFPKTMEGEE